MNFVRVHKRLLVSLNPFMPPDQKNPAMVFFAVLGGERQESSISFL
jgi:hypothetical protein